MGKTTLLPGLEPIPRKWVEVDARSDFSSHYAENKRRKQTLAQEYAKEDFAGEDREKETQQRMQYYLDHEDRFIKRHVKAWHDLANEEWDAFTREYSNHGKNQDKFNNILKLQDVAFGDGLQKVLRQERITKTGDYKADENGDMRLADPDPRFEALRKPLEEICLKQSARTVKKPAQPLNRALIAAIAHQWCEFRGAIPNFEKTTEKTQYFADMQSQRSEPEVALFCNLLYDLISQTYQSMAIQLKQRAYRLNADYDEFLQRTHDSFFRSLSTYREGMGPSFTSWAIGNIRYLISNMLREQHRPGKLLQIATPEEWLDIPTETEPPSRHAIVDDPRRLLPELMQTVLTAKERAVLAGRFSLYEDATDEDSVKQTLEQVGQRLNLTRERVRQIEGAALKKLYDAIKKQREPRGNGNGAPDSAAQDTAAASAPPIPRPHQPAHRRENNELFSFRNPDSDLTACKKQLLAHFTARSGKQMTISDIAKKISSLPGNLSFVFGPHNHSDPTRNGRMSDTVKGKLKGLLAGEGKTPDEIQSFELQWEQLKKLVLAKRSQGTTGYSR